MCGEEKAIKSTTDKRQRRPTSAVRFLYSATTVLNFITANFCSSAMWNVLDIFYEQIYARNNGYSAGYEVQTQKEQK